MAQVFGQRRAQHQLTNAPTTLGQQRNVAAVHPVEEVPDLVTQAVLSQERPVGVCRGRETARDPHPSRGEVREHLAYGSVLAAHVGDVAHADGREVNNVLHASLQWFHSPRDDSSPCLIG